MAAFDERTNRELTHGDLRHPGQGNLMLAHTSLCLCHGQIPQRDNIFPLPCVREEIPRPRRMPQTTAAIDICTNSKVTKYFPVDVSEILPITNRQIVQI